MVLLAEYGVDATSKARDIARDRNGLQPVDVLKVIEIFNAEGRPGGAGGLYTRVTNATPATLAAAEARLAEPPEPRQATPVERTHQDILGPSRQAGQSVQVQRSRHARLMPLHGPTMAALDDAGFWALAGVGLPGPAHRRGDFIWELRVLEHLDNQAAPAAATQGE